VSGHQPLKANPVKDPLDDGSFLDWKRLKSLPEKSKTDNLRHVKLDNPFTLKIDGKRSRAVGYLDSYPF